MSKLLNIYNQIEKERKAGLPTSRPTATRTKEEIPFLETPPLLENADPQPIADSTVFRRWQKIFWWLAVIFAVVSLFLSLTIIAVTRSSQTYSSTPTTTP